MNILGGGPPSFRRLGTSFETFVVFFILGKGALDRRDIQALGRTGKRATVLAFGAGDAAGVPFL